MREIDRNRIELLVASIRELTPGQFSWLERTVQIFQCEHHYSILHSDLLDEETLENFGDALRIHHSFSVEPFSKDKFEYVLERVVNRSSVRAKLASKGNRGHDITIDNTRVSLKTQADKGIRERFMSIEMSLFLEKTIHFLSGFSTTSRLMLHSLAGLDPHRSGCISRASCNTLFRCSKMAFA